MYIYIRFNCIYNVNVRNQRGFFISFLPRAILALLRTVSYISPILYGKAANFAEPAV